ncbi:MAG: flagellar motor protein [candidate division Zixibacteria bacterium]|nr:flagellar motor protein [candidate division Zixibacteria bacterium]MDD5426139.1 flagellar motor protein [candidate division Zixibacteria bacterium]
MDFATIIGLALAFGAVVGGFNLEGGSLEAIFLTAPLLIVIGGTLGATIVTTSMRTVQQVPVYLKVAFFGQSHSSSDLIEAIVHLAEKARREGILGLEPELKDIHDPFFRKAMQLVIDGTEITVLREILETEIAYIEERHKRGIVFFQKAGGFAPTLGILGTVLGLVHTLGSTSDASKMASAIAAAFIATLWGVGLANLFFLPVSDKLRMRHEEEMAYLELIMEGMVAIQSGENPRNIRTRLLSFVAPHHRRHKD